MKLVAGWKRRLIGYAYRGMATMKITVLAALMAFFVPGVCQSGLCRAAELDISVPLQNGRISLVQLRHALASELHLPDLAVEGFAGVNVDIDVRGVNGWLVARAVNGALGDGFHLAVDDDAMRIRVDTAKLPANWDQSCDAVESFTRIAAPEATARQARRFGLHLPRIVDSKMPMVVLIHGLDGNGGSCGDLAELLRRGGYQTATFVYPTERPLEENAELLARHMSALREEFPELRIDLVTESMGGLIARRYVEGPGYAGGVDHFILIAPPNEGSTWVGGLDIQADCERGRVEERSGLEPGVDDHGGNLPGISRSASAIGFSARPQFAPEAVRRALHHHRRRSTGGLSV